jgi:hypothetical protein
MLGRVQRLEQVRRPTRSPYVAGWGSFEAFEAECEAEIDTGKLDEEFRIILECLARWEANGMWNRWQRPNQRGWQLG